MGGVVVILIIAGVSLLISKSSSSKQADEKTSVFEEPEEVIPTVDSSVTASIKGKTEAVITLKGILDGTEIVEYELSYNTKSGSIEGVFGSIEPAGKKTIDEDVTFGTCSSGVCRYHEIVGPVHGSFKFSGSYGERLLEKEFNL